MRIWWCLCFCVIAATVWADAAAPAAIPAPSSPLVDQVGALSDAEHAALIARLQTIQASGRAQIAVLISSGTQGAPLADYALQVAEPFGALALFLAIGGEDFQTQLAQAAAGGGSIAGLLALAARYGLFAAVRIGLGGRFGGGGAGRSG